MDEQPLSLREQGIQALREGDDDRAIDLLTRAVLVDSRDAEARACLGITASRKGLHVRAISALREAVSLEPENTNFRYNLGVALERAGEPREAYLSFQETLRRAPDHAQARQKLAALTPPPGQDARSTVTEAAAPPVDAVSESLIAPEQSPASVVVPEMSADTPLATDEVSSETPWEPRPGAVAEPTSVTDGLTPAAAPPSDQGQPPAIAPPPADPMGLSPPPAWRQPPATGNPAAYPYSGGHQPIPAYGPSYYRPHRGGMVLGLGISSIVVGIVCCGLIGLPLGIAAWVSGNSDLKEMDAGVMDPSGRGQTQAGRVMGIVMTVLSALGILALIAYMVIAFLAAASGAASNGTP